MENKMNPKVDAFVGRATAWLEEMEKLREILLDCGLTEELKWGKPCYSSQGRNIVIIQGFKAYLALLFFKGYLLQDPHGVLVKTGENTKVGRQIRFNDTQEIVQLEPILRAYIAEAIEVEQSGVKGDPIQDTELDIPEEFQHKLDENPALKAAFDALTPGRQRAYVYYFSVPKQSKTRESRIEKCTQQILDGKGLNDR
ncbi:hypothetical protein J2TS6_29120 [Paenibacillus albilobatus]|uniref:YdhG-like domain-containing protein n=1 Tax=Paenibacillus albilobatus TaxID=2716884 RepID=A0A919XGJ0_9BACL|nr:YdeI/OmpD-associated family protein [Paenibacillus albilobatus]GIO31771.1 hypothetical protein J2TS6_29120 [Paenibacillus albilobatus]